MSSQAIGQRFRVSRGGCWQCVANCRSRLAEVLTSSQMAYNVKLTAGEAGPVRPGLRQVVVLRRLFIL